MRLVITGSEGILGSALRLQYKSDDILSFDLKNGYNIFDFNNSIKIIKDFNPDIIIHCAAYTNVSKAEKDEENAFKINVYGSRNIAQAAAALNIPIVYVSTDFVFDGRKAEPYNEFDIPNPLSVYGKTKYYGESITKELCSKFYIIRTSWLYGSNGENFVTKMMKLGKSNDSLSIVHDQIGTPTYAEELAEHIKLVIDNGLFGTYHLSNKGFTSWADFAEEIFRITNIECKVTKITSDEFMEKFKDYTQRPKYSVLENMSLELNLKNNFSHWKDALKKYLRSNI